MKTKNRNRRKSQFWQIATLTKSARGVSDDHSAFVAVQMAKDSHRAAAALNLAGTRTADMADVRQDILENIPR